MYCNAGCNVNQHQMILLKAAIERPELSSVPFDDDILAYTLYTVFTDILDVFFSRTRWTN